MNWEELQEKAIDLFNTYPDEKSVLIGFWFAIIDHGEYNFVQWVQDYWSFKPPNYSRLDEYNELEKRWYHIFDGAFMKVYIEELKPKNRTFVELYK